MQLHEHASEQMEGRKVPGNSVRELSQHVRTRTIVLELIEEIESARRRSDSAEARRDASVSAFLPVKALSGRIYLGEI